MAGRGSEPGMWLTPASKYIPTPGWSSATAKTGQDALRETQGTHHEHELSEH